MTIANAFCVFEGIVSVSIADTSLLQVSADPTEIYLGESSQLNAEFLPGYTITWSPSSSLSAPKIPNPVAMPTETTTYTARVSVGNGCTLERSVTIRVAAPQCDEPFLFFPTGFSPNGDGENDELKLEGRYVESVYWAIYNRWGQLVFETSDPEGAWDGTYKGEPQPAETYGYYLRLKCPGGQETFKKGNVTLLR